MRKKCRYADIPIEKKKHIDEIPKQEKKKKKGERNCPGTKRCQSFDTGHRAYAEN